MFQYFCKRSPGFYLLSNSYLIVSATVYKLREMHVCALAEDVQTLCQHIKLPWLNMKRMHTTWIQIAFCLTCINFLWRQIGKILSNYIEVHQKGTSYKVKGAGFEKGMTWDIKWQTLNRLRIIDPVITIIFMYFFPITLFSKRNATFLKMPFFWRRVYARSVKTLWQGQWPRGTRKNGQINVAYTTKSIISLFS